MKKSKRVTYTLPMGNINFIEKLSYYYDISKSKFVSNCIEDGFKLMEEELEDLKNGEYENIYEIGKKMSDTKPITFSIPQSVVDRLNYYSSELGVKKSHLVGISVYLMYEKINKILEDDIDDLMEEVESTEL